MQGDGAQFEKEMTNREYNELKSSLPAQIQKQLNDVVIKMTPPNYNDVNIKRVAEVVCDLVDYRVTGIEPFLGKLSRRAVNKDELFDILREGRFAAILAKNGFTDIFLEPFEPSISGPDIKAGYDGEVVYFEVTRRREAGDEWKLAEPGIVGCVDTDRTENIISRILNKTTQLQIGNVNIIVLWSDTIRLLHREVAESFKYIAQEIADDPNKYRELSAVLFTTGGVSYPDPKQFDLFVNPNATNKLSDSLIQKLKTMTERDLTELKEEYEALTAALRRHINEARPLPVDEDL